MSLTSNVTAYKNKMNTLRGNNSVVNFGYTAGAYNSDNADGVEVYDPEQGNNIPVKTNSIINLNPFVTNKGLRDQSSSFPRMFINHFFGRVSYNLNKSVDVLYSLLSSLEGAIGLADGIATLDNDGRVPESQLTEDAIVYRGAWNAESNVPDLDTVTKTKGDMYIVSVGCTRALVDGEGLVTYNVGDQVIFNGVLWQKIPTGNVDSINNIDPSDGGNVTLDGEDISYTNSSVGSADISQAIAYIKNKLGYSS